MHTLQVHNLSLVLCMSIHVYVHINNILYLTAPTYQDTATTRPSYNYIYIASLLHQDSLQFSRLIFKGLWSRRRRADFKKFLKVVSWNPAYNTAILSGCNQPPVTTTAIHHLRKERGRFFKSIYKATCTA